MRLSKKCEYALRALTCLSAPGGAASLSIQEIARREKVPKKFLEQVLLALKKAGIVQSSRGKTGGYVLQGIPAAITLEDIMRAVDGPLALLPCTSASNPVKCADCPSLERCWLRTMMVEVEKGLTDTLARITLAEMSRRVLQSRPHPLTYQI